MTYFGAVFDRVISWRIHTGAIAANVFRTFISVLGVINKTGNVRTYNLISRRVRASFVVVETQ